MTDYPIRYLQKTKIPARGLKMIIALVIPELMQVPASKNQNPREGIENSITSLLRVVILSLQKTKIPARGLKTAYQHKLTYQITYKLQKTKIPARGLKIIAYD